MEKDERSRGLASPHDILTAYSEGRISSRQAIAALHLDGYRDLFIAMCDAGHPLPRPPQDEVDAQVAAATPIIAAHLNPETTDPSDERIARAERFLADRRRQLGIPDPDTALLRDLANMDEVDVRPGIGGTGCGPSTLDLEAMDMSPDPVSDAAARRAAKAAGLSDDDIDDMLGPPISLDHYDLQRDPDESDEDYARRRSLFE